MEEKEESPGNEAVATGPKPILWVRPLVGLFSIITALMYLCAAAALFVFHLMIKHNATLSTEDKVAMAQRASESGESLEEASARVEQASDLGQTLVTHFGLVFVVLVAMIAGAALMIGFSGIGLLGKKIWAISVGRVGCITLILAVVLLLLFHKEGMSAMAQLQQEQEQEAVAAFTWMSAVRYMFLCSMCPISLIIAYGVVVKQYVGNAES